MLEEPGRVGTFLHQESCNNYFCLFNGDVWIPAVEPSASQWRLWKLLRRLR
jgi:hypothetical protein